VSVKFDAADFAKRAEQLSGAIDQLPYVMSRLMNDAAFQARRVLSESTWPSHVHQKRTSFPGVALHVQKATKSDLTVIIVDTLGRAHLQQHSQGGVVRARGRNLTIPPKGTTRRISARQLIDRTPKRALRRTPTGIFVGQGGMLHLKYSLKPSVTIRADVPFVPDFEDAMRRSVSAGFPAMMDQAMKTRK
jgi:hypothetical protein